MLNPTDRDQQWAGGAERAYLFDPKRKKYAPNI
jgi:hypothetical protein